MTSSAQFLINVDIGTLENYCLTSRAHYNTCKNQAFWIEKFKHDLLPLPYPLPTTLRTWIDSHNVISKYMDEAVEELEHAIEDIIKNMYIACEAQDAPIDDDEIMNLKKYIFYQNLKKYQY